MHATLESWDEYRFCDVGYYHHLLGPRRTFEGEIDDLVFMLIPTGYSRATLKILPLLAPALSSDPRDEIFSLIVSNGVWCISKACCLCFEHGVFIHTRCFDNCLDKDGTHSTEYLRVSGRSSRAAEARRSQFISTWGCTSIFYSWIEGQPTLHQGGFYAFLFLAVTMSQLHWLHSILYYLKGKQFLACPKGKD